ncbi:MULTISPECIES: transporter substrate-binding domain-containing protein [unclassified Chelatococcus]|uniref:transporter substrate-binding domain-containing protein n=1 Tax=unclassified Chelatococcus TaxID=2638111 RepID=UPI001BCAA483|nr:MULTISPECIES: transporter substrate-binding domain-containing protein [unclassified Chelatococcus]MBS7700107.1 transporter substrate-binding domain-containing protein [Chelatococcus sp. YT9]MBX3556800.1 transporter substrate-binding domain-containing protein [Chelatococcus sp.]
MVDLVKRFARFATVVFGLSLATTAVAQQPSNLQELKAAGELKVGVLVDFPPFGIMNEKNEPDGFDIDVAKALAKRMGLKVKLVPITGPNRIPFLQTGKVDMLVASLAITKERAEQVLFSQPYAAIQGVLYARKDLPIKSYADLGGLSVGVARGSPQDTQVTKNAPSNTKIQRFDEITAVYQAVLAGQVDAAVVSSLVALELAKQLAATYETKFVLYQQVQGVAMRKGSDALAAEVNSHIGDMLASGELNQVNRKWLHSDLPKLTSDL